MATTAGTLSSSNPLPSTASTLWAHLLHRYSDTSKVNAASAVQPSSSYAQLTPQDKAGTSTRILLHDTHARLEKFSERANAIFSELEASRREMVRVREQVENAREQEFEEITQLINRCQSSLQKAIGEPLQAHQATAMQANLTLTSERLHSLEDKLNNRLDVLTALLETQSQLSRSLQEQFSRAQDQQSRILELLAPLHPMLQSVPLHIDVARNAIMENFPPRGCRCFHDSSDLSSPLTAPPGTSSSEENAEVPVPVVTRKRRKICMNDTPHANDQCQPPMRSYQDRPVAVEEQHRRLPELVRRGSAGARTAAQSRGMHGLLAVQTPSGEKGDSGPSEATSRYHSNAQPHNGAAALATTLSAILRIPPNESVGRKDKRNSTVSSRFPIATVPGKRFIPINDEDDDDDL